MKKAAKHRDDFRKLAQMRIREAQCLFAAGLHEGAFYVAGYAVECGLKACYARKMKRFEFPPDVKEVQRVYTHDLDELAKRAGVNDHLQHGSTRLAVNWGLVSREWSEKSRYDLGIDSSAAKQLIVAISDRRDGVLACVRKHW